ncbi:MAG TPA: FAD:protein FMN transferase [Bryobacteraceae bacterium]|jgi:thiamine biosynthesis lipoprotein|nr:FAD:protein FMN transferase [Bryobacteraceae bacterium]
MKSCSLPTVTERAQPWLGTLVSIRVEGLPASDAHPAISAAFQEIEQIDRLMSFHRSESDVSRLNRDGSVRRIPVDARTLTVLQQAIALSQRTSGCFDVTIGAELVSWGWLPQPVGANALTGGTWRDVEIHRDHTVSLRRPVWIDFGGIAKGYAVDRAIECLRAQGIARAVVNAGGDIRVLGQECEPIAVGVEVFAESIPIIELADGSIASSGRSCQRDIPERVCGPHVDGLSRRPISRERFVCVLAESCMIADALTKVVMAMGSGSRPILGEFGAAAHLWDASTGWQSLNPAMECP